MAYYDSLTKMYPVTKTIRQELRPVGRTLENIKRNNIIEADAKRKEDYVKVKTLMDDFHKQIIEDSLSNMNLDGLQEFEELYWKNVRTEDEECRFDNLISSMRKQIADCLVSNRDYEIAFSAKLIEERLPENANEEDKDALQSFRRFTTYFTDYYKNRKNLYSDEEKHSTVAYRCINENLFIFLSNMKIYKIFKKAQIKVDAYSEEELDKTFMIEFFNDCLCQTGIEKYNDVIAALRSVTNLYSQQHNKDLDFVKIPKFKVLYKQVLSDRTSKFEILSVDSDEELLNNLESFESNLKQYLNNGLAQFKSGLIESEGKNVYIKNDTSLTEFSVLLTGSWRTIRNAYDEEYDKVNLKKQITEKYIEIRDKAFKKISSVELYQMNQLIEVDLLEEYVKQIDNDLEMISEKARVFTEKVLVEHDRNKKLQNNISAVVAIKDYLDSVKMLERHIKLLAGTGLEIRNDFFYGEYASTLEHIAEVDGLYNLTRNYLSKKPFSTEKMKLNFNNPQLLGGWDVNKEKDCYGVILLKGGNYYLGIMDKSANKSFVDVKSCDDSDGYKKANIKLLPGPNKMFPKVFFSARGIDYYDPDKTIKKLYDKGTFKKGNNFNLQDCHALIDFYKESINKHEDWKKFDFNFSDTSNYQDISGFFREVESQNYKITYSNISSEYIDSLVDEGKLYLFQIYNKDFSEFSKGNLNLHTLYLKMLFDERNLNELNLKLNGEAEVFYRKASIGNDEKVIHKANQKIKNKNSNNVKKESLFQYDIVKDNRYTQDKFFIHIPITFNYTTQSVAKYNDVMNEILKKEKGVRTIGIDRGERNLLYVVVCDTDGSILYQKSLNEIISRNNITDYHKILDNKEKERLNARKDWKSITNIKDLKSGYLSQVVNVIYKLIIEYNAIVVLEDLNMGFKQGRTKVEKQVYQNFEKALIDKLNFLCLDKSREQKNPMKAGGVLNAYQLTAPFTSFEKMGKQTGCIFYIPAYLTSQIDPTTGFANLFYAKYTSKDEAKKFFAKFDSIRFNQSSGDFEFAFDYNNFTYKASGTKTEWTISTHGARIEKYRSDDANGNWVDRTVYPTEIIKNALTNEGISFEDGHNLHNDILKIESSSFFKELYRGFNRTVQLRNSSLDGAEDYIISPVKNCSGYYFDSRLSDGSLPCDADANGAYNIARKGLWALEQIRQADDLRRIKLAISNKEWLVYAQENIPDLLRNN